MQEVILYDSKEVLDLVIAKASKATGVPADQLTAGFVSIDPEQKTAEVLVCHKDSGVDLVLKT